MTEYEAEDENLSKTREEVLQLVDTLKKKNAELSKDMRIPILYQDTRTKNAELELKIAHARQASASSDLTPQMCEDITKRHAEKETIVKKRRRLCMGILDRMMESSDLTLERIFLTPILDWV